MTIAFNFDALSLKKTDKTGKAVSTKKAVDPIANRAFAKVPWIAELVQPDEPEVSERELIARAWAISPERTLQAMFSSGMKAKQVAGKLGVTADSDDFKRAVAIAKANLKEELAAEYTAAIPDEFEIELTLEDGTTATVDIANKLKAAVVNSLFGSKDTVKLSARKGYSIETDLGSLLKSSAEQVSAIKTNLKNRYADVFPTRETGPAEISFTPAALAKFMVLDTPADTDDADTETTSAVASAE